MEKYTNEVTDEKIISVLDKVNETYIPEINTEKTETSNVSEAQTLTDSKAENKEIEQASDKPKKKRGRPRKGEEVNKPNTDKPQTQGNEIDLSKYQPANIEAQPEQNTVNVAQYVSGGLLLILIDTVVPELLKLVMPKLKNLKNRNAIKLSKEEREELKPLADEAIKSLSLQLSPVEGLLLAMAFMYGGKVATLDDYDYREPEVKKPKK